MKFDILIKNALLLTVNGQMEVYDSGSVGIQSGIITFIGKTETTDPEADNVIDACGNIVMPGLINAHTHSPMSVFRGMADDIALFDWLNNYIWPVEKEFVTEENIELASELSIAEMIKSGTTAFNDMYFYSDVTARVAERIGIRAVLGEAVIDIPDPVYKVAEHHWKTTAENGKKSGLITTSIVPHSPYSCSEDLLKHIKQISKKTGILVHTHISETANEVEHIQRKYGMTPVGFLDDINFLDGNTVAVHCVELTDTDIEILAKNNVKIVHCPQSNLKLASGIARVVDMVKAGLTIALGTDGPASNNSLDMFAEMKMAGILHKGIKKDPTVISAAEVIKMATINGAAALGLDKITGSIEIGKKADIIIIDSNSLHMTPMYDPYSALVYSANGSDVDTVIIEGKIVMKNKVLINIDETSLKHKANILSEKIKEFKRIMEEKQ
jgi:5-methylthioadenosine/S-adenosylhomocysteine deaminase